VLLSNKDQLTAEWLQISSAGNILTSVLDRQDGGQWIHLPLDGSMALEDMDRHIIQTALALHDHNVMATARALGTTRETLRYRIQKYGLAKT
jgi:transcriptional regulator with GAF, ATPase, and Fis domain